MVLFYFLGFFWQEFDAVSFLMWKVDVRRELIETRTGGKNYYLMSIL